MASGDYNVSFYSPAATFPACATFPRSLDQLTQDARRRRDFSLSMGRVPFQPRDRTEAHQLYRIPPHLQHCFGTSLVPSAAGFSRLEHVDGERSYAPFGLSNTNQEEKELGPTYSDSSETSHPSNSPAEDISASPPTGPPASSYHTSSPMTMNANATTSFNQSLHVSSTVSNLRTSSAYYVDDYQHPTISSPEPLSPVPSPRSKPSHSQIGSPTNGNEASPAPSLLYPPLSHPPSPEVQFHHEHQSHARSEIDQQHTDDFTPWHLRGHATPVSTQPISPSRPTAGVEVGLRHSSASSLHNLGSPLIDEQEGQSAGRGDDRDQCGGRFEGQLGVGVDTEAETAFHQRQPYQHEHQSPSSSSSFGDHSESYPSSSNETMNITQPHRSFYSELSANVTFLSQHHQAGPTSFDESNTVEMGGPPVYSSNSDYGQPSAFVAHGSNCGATPSLHEEPMPARLSQPVVAEVNAPTPRYPHSPHQLSLAVSDAVENMRPDADVEPSQNGTLVPLSHYNRVRRSEPASQASPYSSAPFPSQNHQSFQLRNPPTYYQLQERRQQRHSFAQRPYPSYPSYDECRPVHISNQSHHLRSHPYQHHTNESPPLDSLSPLLHESSPPSTSITASSLASTSSISAPRLHPIPVEHGHGHNLDSQYHARSNTTLVSRTMAELGSTTGINHTEGCFTMDGTYIDVHDPSFSHYGPGLVRGGEPIRLSVAALPWSSTTPSTYTTAPQEHSTPFSALPLLSSVALEHAADEPGMENICGSPISPVTSPPPFTFSTATSISESSLFGASSLASAAPLTAGHYSSFSCSTSNGPFPPPTFSTPPPVSQSRKVPPPPSLNIRRGGEQKKQTLACLFCRERKIACGRPAHGSNDPTCNQCARRCFKCEYPTESKRGQHKRAKKKMSAEKAPN